MNIQVIFLSFALCTLFLYACGDTTTTTETGTTETTTETPTETTTNKTIIATFEHFELGDAAHFMFKDESGKDWDFGACMAKDYTFEVESPDGPQGFGPNKELVGKKFKLEYETKKMPMYQDGPEGDVDVIISATML